MKGKGKGKETLIPCFSFNKLGTIANKLLKHVVGTGIQGRMKEL